VVECPGKQSGQPVFVLSGPEVAMIMLVEQEEQEEQVVVVVTAPGVVVRVSGRGEADTLVVLSARRLEIYPLAIRFANETKYAGGKRGEPRKVAYRPFTWTDDCVGAFAALKRAICTAPVLAFPTKDNPFPVHTDASQYAVGAVLSQRQKDGVKVIG
jgi:hypothetical protein